MVRGYDPTTSDISALLWNYIFSFANADQRVTLEDAQRYVKYWLTHSELTKQTYLGFASMAMKPIIRLKKHCPQTLALKTEGVLKQDYQHFSTATDGNQISICLAHVANKLQLKQNLDRELTFLLLQGRNKQTNTAQEQEQALMKDLYQSCYSGYRNYKLAEGVTKEMAVICSKYLFFRKSRSTLPVDRKFRYATQLADQLLL